MHRINYFKLFIEINHKLDGNSLTVKLAFIFGFYDFFFVFFWSKRKDCEKWKEPILWAKWMTDSKFYSFGTLFSINLNQFIHSQTLWMYFIWTYSSSMPKHSNSSQQQQQQKQTSKKKKTNVIYDEQNIFLHYERKRRIGNSLSVCT